MQDRDASEAPEGFRRGPLLKVKQRSYRGRIEEKRSIHGIYVHRTIMLVQVTEGGVRRGHCVVLLLTGDCVTLESCASGASFSFVLGVSFFPFFFCFVNVRAVPSFVRVGEFSRRISGRCDLRNFRVWCLGWLQVTSATSFLQAGCTRGAQCGRRERAVVFRWLGKCYY